MYLVVDSTGARRIVSASSDVAAVRAVAGTLAPGPIRVVELRRGPVTRFTITQEPQCTES